MRTAGQIQDISNRLVSLSQSLVSHAYVRAERIEAIRSDPSRSEEWKNQEFEKVQSLAEIQALHAQVQILKADLEPEIAAWENPSQVLRLAALPSGVTSDAASVQALLQAEAVALESDPLQLQAAILDAANSKDWSRLYALTLGRLDSMGNPLKAFQGRIQGIRLDCLDLPGQESALESFYRARVGWMEAEEAFAKAKGEAGNYTTQHLLIRAGADYEKAKHERRARIQLTPSEALERAEQERTEPAARYRKIDAPKGCYCIFDALSGSTHTVGEEEGPAYLHRLNHPFEVK